MNKKIYFIPIVLLAILGAVQYGCKEEADEICQSFSAECGAVDMATTCCTDAKCYYEYEGKLYDNDAEGMEDLIADMCPADNETSASVVEIKSRLKSQTEELIAEARASVICE
jgi:hypothetical protein